VIQALKQAAWATGLFRAVMTVVPPRGVCVLCYHAVKDAQTAPADLPFSGLHVSADRLDEQLAALRSLATPLTTRQYRHLLAGDADAPPRAVHVTFDDGYRSVFTRALPLLERHDMPASVFIATRPVARAELFWYDAVARERGPDAVERLRRTAANRWPAHLAEWRRSAHPADEAAPLSPDHVAELARHPLVEIGGHTESHPSLAALAPQDQRAEIVGCLDTLESWTGQRPGTFAYPTGCPGDDFDATTVAMVREAGVALAFTTEYARAGRTRPPLEQPRFVMTDQVDGVELAYRIAWGWPR
jgi:peptidoglycan/xylan/chitin deacetylase (PgdA/CDA1 family)